VINAAVLTISDSAYAGTRTDLSGPSVRERLERLVTHTELFEELYRSNDARTIGQGGRLKNFEVMKKHYKSYTTGHVDGDGGSGGFDGAKELRIRLMDAKDTSEVRQIVQDFLNKS